MKTRQRHILRVLSSICVGSMAFCLTLLVTLLVGSILLSLLGLLDGDGFFPPEFVILLLISLFVAIAIALFVGRKYYHYNKDRLDA